MKLENITPSSLHQVSDREILALHFRIHQLAAQFYRQHKLSDPLLRVLESKHRLIAYEMIDRGLRFRIVDDLDSRALPDIKDFIIQFASLIPDEISLIPKKELLKLHSQLHSVWVVVHAQHLDLQQQEQLWNWHRLVVNALHDRGVEHEGFDSLDKPLGQKSRIFPSGVELGDWIFLEDFLNQAPNSLMIEPEMVVVDTHKNLVYVNSVGGRQLTKVCYFRLLRQFPRDLWSQFQATSLDSLESVDVVYSLVLNRLNPVWVVQLNLQFDDLCLVKPYLYLVGGLVTQGVTKNDVDVLLRGGLSIELEELIFEKFCNAFPQALNSRFSLLHDEGLGPYTDYVGLYSLDLIRVEANIQ